MSGLEYAKLRPRFAGTRLTVVEVLVGGAVVAQLATRELKVIVGADRPTELKVIVHNASVAPLGEAVA